MIEGLFFVLEGIDGSGTTTQAGLLSHALQAKGLPVLATREPTAGPVGSLLRQALGHRWVVPGMHGPRPPSWKTLALLFAADRLDHLEAEILPNLLDGVSIVCDRYDLSSLAYQSVAIEPDEQDSTVAWLRNLNQYARRPDLTVVLDVTPAVAAQRRRGRGQPAELYEEGGLQAKLAVAYDHAEALVPSDRLVHVDGNRSIEDVASDVWQVVQSFRTQAHSSIPSRS